MMTARDVPEEIRQAAQTLVAQSGNGPLRSVRALAGGRNNRVFRVESDSVTAILKHYYRSPAGGRDRFASEMAWYRFCEDQDIPQVPRLWGFDVEAACALFAEVPGRKLLAGEVTKEHVAQAANFFTQVNAHRHAASAAEMPFAAEACLTLDDYVSGVERRLARLSQVVTEDAPSRSLQVWLTGALQPVWSAVQGQMSAAFPPAERSAVLPREQRCLSPSDFGFHNALLDSHQILWFLDFEYAGWDDPAKTVCDFLWQVDVPAPRAAQSIFLDAVQPFEGNVVQRVRALFPLFGVKWATIVLNEFLPESQSRRNFAAGEHGAEDRRLRQLAVAQRLLDDVQTHLGSG